MSKDLTDALAALTQSGNDGATPMPAPNSRGAKPRITASGVDAPVQSSAGGSATATGPFVETDFTTREFHEAKYWTTDGIFSFPAVKKIHMKDGNNTDTTIELKAPT